MGGRRDDDEIFADINITPFVDIILVVLILFMVTATTIVQSTIPVDLPDAATGEASTEISLGLTLTQTGELLLDGILVDEETLRLRLNEAKATGESVVCLIAADTSTPHGRVVWLLDLLRTEGIARFAIQVDKTTASPLPGFDAP